MRMPRYIDHKLDLKYSFVHTLYYVWVFFGIFGTSGFFLGGLDCFSYLMFVPGLFCWGTALLLSITLNPVAILITKWRKQVDKEYFAQKDGHTNRLLY